MINRLVNVVVTADTSCKLDLQKLSKTLLNSEYFPRKFAALKLCQTSPYFSKALVFGSGKIVCVGATSIERAFDALKWFVTQIDSILHLGIEITNKKVQNLVATTSLIDPTQSVNLNKVFQKCTKFIQYEPVRPLIITIFTIFTYNQPNIFSDDNSQNFTGIVSRIVIPSRYEKTSRFKYVWNRALCFDGFEDNG